MSASSGSASLWWDRDLDSTGNPIRPDVRASAHEVWNQANARVRAELGDDGDAAGLMEKSVVQVSRYLDRNGAALDTTESAGLLMSAFSRALRRHARRLRRIELVGDIDRLAEFQSPARCISNEDCRLDAEKARRLLSDRARTMLDLRTYGFEWREIAKIMRTTECAARAEFWREIRNARRKIMDKSGHRYR